MATKQDLELARRLLRAGVLEEAQIRKAFEIQGRLLEEEDRQVTLERVLYGTKVLPTGALAPLSAPPLFEQQPFANYQLQDEIGIGGVGTVYSAIYTPNGTPVAVKVLDPVQALRDDFRDRFYREANLHIALDHPNIVAGYEVGSENGYHFYSMDLIEGVTVLDVILRRGHLENDEALSVVLQAAEALEYIHEMGMVHRDIKPGNIMVEESGHARMIDLGLVGKMGLEGEEVSEASMTVGTVEYLSPEQARGRSDLDARSDLYSLGITLYHMVVGEVPFQGETDYEVMAKQILTSVDAQKIKQRSIRPEVYFLIAKLSAKEREERYRSSAEALQVIRGYLPDGVLPIDLGIEPSVYPAGDEAVRRSSPQDLKPAQPPPSPSPLRSARRTPGRGRRKDDGGDAPRRTRRRYR